MPGTEQLPIGSTGPPSHAGDDGPAWRLWVEDGRNALLILSKWVLRFLACLPRRVARLRPWPPSPAFTVHLHVVPTRSWATQNERILRDHLISHPADAQRYGDLKRRLAAVLDCE